MTRIKTITFHALQSVSICLSSICLSFGHAWLTSFASSRDLDHHHCCCCKPQPQPQQPQLRRRRPQSLSVPWPKSTSFRKQTPYLALPRELSFEPRLLFFCYPSSSTSPSTSSRHGA
ncbi:uncharacterized protein IWZ02DRAFT_295795 [Phyllosticta citriasiana]|uniref:uncharacterized protein n=1 Tax=Phyllosticta citriasiana TaxID=595635 RepID=UPI0030FD2ECC